MDRAVHISQVTGKTLVDDDVRERVVRETGWPLCCVVRATFANFVQSNLLERGIPLHWNKKLVDVKQEDDRVTAFFEDGSTDEGDLLIGCDGLHSQVRDRLFGKTPAVYTGSDADRRIYSFLG